MNESAKLMSTKNIEKHQQQRVNKSEVDKGFKLNFQNKVKDMHKR